MPALLRLLSSRSSDKAKAESTKPESSGQEQQEQSAEHAVTNSVVVDTQVVTSMESTRPASSEGARGPVEADSPSATPALPTITVSTVPPATTTDSSQITHVQILEESKPPNNIHRRFSWRPLSFLNSQPHETHKAELTAVQEHGKKEQVRQDLIMHSLKSSRADKQAKQSAMIVRSLIVGPSSITSSDLKAKAVSKKQMEKVRSQLSQPKSANKVIAQLRALPSSDELMSAKPAGLPAGPIHAVCLAYTDAEVHERHFAPLTDGSHEGSAVRTESSVNVTSAVGAVASVTNASMAQVTALFSELHIVSLITTPDLGIGQPGDGPGLLSGAIPTADTVLQGIQQVTPQLMALGYATGKTILPDHTGVYPPTDRMSAITYWWGFEIVLPPPSIQYLSNVPSVAHSIINFLTGLAMVAEGVREILPFIRYISQYIDTEFNMIKQQDQGQGVVCAATWILPAALVPRPWDFPAPPPAESLPISRPPVDQPIVHEPTPGDGSSVPILPPPSSAPTLPPISIRPPEIFTPNTASPIDVAAVKDEKNKDVPNVTVIPPTPPTIETLRGVPKEIGDDGPITITTTPIAVAA